MEQLRSIASRFRKSPDAIDRTLAFYSKADKSGINVARVRGVVFLGGDKTESPAPPSIQIEPDVYSHVFPSSMVQKKGPWWRRKAVVNFYPERAADPTEIPWTEISRIPIIGRDAPKKLLEFYPLPPVSVVLFAGKKAEENILAVAKAASESVRFHMEVQDASARNDRIRRDVNGSLI